MLLQAHLHLPAEQKDPWKTRRALQKQSYLARTRIPEQTIALCIAKTHQMAGVARIQVEEMRWAAAEEQGQSNLGEKELQR